jgi:hypothetical protein
MSGGIVEVLPVETGAAVQEPPRKAGAKPA